MSVPSLSSAGCLGAQLESVTYGRTDRRQVNIVLTPALLGWCQGLSWAIVRAGVDPEKKSDERLVKLVEELSAGLQEDVYSVEGKAVIEQKTLRSL